MSGQQVAGAWYRTLVDRTILSKKQKNVWTLFPHASWYFHAVNTQMHDGLSGLRSIATAVTR